MGTIHIFYEDAMSKPMAANHTSLCQTNMTPQVAISMAVSIEGPKPYGTMGLTQKVSTRGNPQNCCSAFCVHVGVTPQKGAASQYPSMLGLFPGQG